MDTIADAIAADIGVKLMPCILQNSTGITDADEQKIRDATTARIAGNSNVVAGPDFSDMSSDDAFHFESDAKLTTAASRWWTAISTWLAA